jgi:hypothetical protein
MKLRKKPLLIGGGALVVLVALLALPPLAFGGRIEERARLAIKDAVDVHVDFDGVSITVLRNFPNLTFSLRNLVVTGDGSFAGDTLAHVERLRLVVDLGSVLGAYRGGGELVVRSIIVDRPYLHARVLEDGTASWDVLGAGDTASTGPAGGGAAAERGFRAALRRFEVNGARIVLDDAEAGLHASITGLDHTLRGDFTQERFTLEAATEMERVTVRQHGVVLLNGARVGMDAELDADLASRRFTFRDNRLRLNELGLEFDGSFQLADDRTEIDLTFAADRADLAAVLSLVPAIYAREFSTLRTAGTVAVNGHVKGGYAADDFPAFALKLDVRDGMFRYPDLPLPARDIFIDLAVSNPGGDADSTVARLDRLAITVGDEPFSARMTVATPVSDPEVDLTLSGRLDLEGLSRTVELEGIEELRGMITTDAAVRTRLSYLEGEDYDRVAARGRIEIRELAAAGAALPNPVYVDDMRLELSPRRAELEALRARVGSSDFRITGTLDNVLGFALLKSPLRGSAVLESDYVALDEWRSTEESELENIPVPGDLDLALSARIGRMTLGDLEMTDARGAVRIREERLTLDSFALQTLDGEIVTSGWYETTDVAHPTFDFDFAMADIDIARAFATFNTVRVLAPAAAYTTGRFGADLRMNGALGSDMAPAFDLLNGRGAIRTVGAAVHGLPALHRVADALHLDELRDPALEDFAASIEIREGKLHVEPFDVRLGRYTMNVSGLNAIDQSIDYRVLLEVPRSELGAEADRVISGLVSESANGVMNLAVAAAVRVGARIGGTMTDPIVGLDPGSAVAARSVATQAVAQRVDDGRAKAQAQARARADALVHDADARAAAMVAEAEELAAAVRLEGDRQADRLLAEASNPLAQRAARIAGDRIRREANERADQMVREANERAAQLRAQARLQADGLVGEAR